MRLRTQPTSSGYRSMCRTSRRVRARRPHCGTVLGSGEDGVKPCYFLDACWWWRQADLLRAPGRKYLYSPLTFPLVAFTFSCLDLQPGILMLRLLTLTRISQSLEFGAIQTGHRTVCNTGLRNLKMFQKQKRSNEDVYSWCWYVVKHLPTLLGPVL